MMFQLFKGSAIYIYNNLVILKCNYTPQKLWKKYIKEIFGERL